MAGRYVVYMDSNGDTQGNYTLIGQQPYEKHHEHGLYPVGLFHIPKANTTIPVIFPPIPNQRSDKSNND